MTRLFYFFFLVPFVLFAQEMVVLDEEGLHDTILFGQASLTHSSGATLYPNQDCVFLGKIDEYIVMAVYDGHGRNGYELSRVVRDIFNVRLKEIIENEKREYGFVNSFVDVLKRSFEYVQDYLLESKIIAYKSGTTAVVSILDPKTKNLYTAHVGDSRALVARNGHVLFVTKDQKAEDEQEAARYVIDGEVILRVRRKRQEPMRLEGLIPSRSMGDYALFDRAFSKYDHGQVQRARKLFSEPEITQFQLEQGDWLVLATDGLWDAATNEGVAQSLQKIGMWMKSTSKEETIDNTFEEKESEACGSTSHSDDMETTEKTVFQMIMDLLDPDDQSTQKGHVLRKVAKELVDDARKAGSTDDITALVIRLK